MAIFSTSLPVAIHSMESIPHSLGADAARSWFGIFIANWESLLEIFHSFKKFVINSFADHIEDENAHHRYRKADSIRFTLIWFFRQGCLEKILSRVNNDARSLSHLRFSNRKTSCADGNCRRLIRSQLTGTLTLLLGYFWTHQSTLCLPENPAAVNPEMKSSQVRVFIERASSWKVQRFCATKRLNSKRFKAMHRTFIVETFNSERRYGSLRNLYKDRSTNGIVWMRTIRVNHSPEMDLRGCFDLHKKCSTKVSPSTYQPIEFSSTFQ